MSTLPADLGYRMPAEWESHEATWIAWPRDSGPAFIKGPDGVAQVNGAFNGWAKYLNYRRDRHVSRRIGKRLGPRCWYPEAGRRVVLEGGSFDVNGEGLLLTTEECLL